jgi:hypothetical protein
MLSSSPSAMVLPSGGNPAVERLRISVAGFVIGALLATQAATACGVGDGGGSVRLKPEELAGRWKEARARVSFTVRPTTSSGEEREGSATLYVLAGVVRLDVAGDGGESTVIIVPYEGPGNDSIFSCSDARQRCSGEGSDPLLYAFLIPLFRGPAWLTGGEDNGGSGLEVREEDTDRRIAGNETRCFLRSWEAVGEERRSRELFNDAWAGSTEVCYTADALPLAYNFSTTDNGGTSGFRFEATSVSGDVSSSDIQPPYPTAGLLPTPTPRDVPPGTATAEAVNDGPRAEKALLTLSDFPPGWTASASSSGEARFHIGSELFGETRTALAQSPFFVYAESSGPKMLRHTVALYSTAGEATAACAEDRVATAVMGRFEEIMGGGLGIDVTRSSLAPLHLFPDARLGAKSSAQRMEIDFKTDTGVEVVVYSDVVCVTNGRSSFLVSANRYGSPFDADELLRYVEIANQKASDAQ